MTTKTIFIIGSGAIGRALAVFLKLTDRDVILLRGSEEVKTEHDETFQVDLPTGETVTAIVTVSSLNWFSTLDGIVVLTNKSFGNPDLARRLKEKVGNSPIVLLQNGLNIETAFTELGFSQVYRCVLFATSQVTVGNKLRFRPVAVSPIGIIKGSAEGLNDVIHALNSSYFNFDQVADIQPVIWKKVIANCVFNSVCPLIEVDNGIFHRNEGARAIARRVIKECVHIARVTAGVALSEEEVLQGVVRISQASDGQFISTLQDIRSKRTTEIDTLNFSIVRLAEKAGLADLISETRLLGELTKLKSELSR